MCVTAKSVSRLSCLGFRKLTGIMFHTEDPQTSVYKVVATATCRPELVHTLCMHEVHIYVMLVMYT